MNNRCLCFRCDHVLVEKLEEQVRTLEAQKIAMMQVLNETNEALTENGWHTDRGLLFRIREVLSAVNASEETKEGKCKPK